ncbi:MAG: type II toxin-antitoxin system RatA family toxin [Hyphomicrobiaceae bacterium]
MPSFSTRRSVAFTPNQMFDLVADIEKYPQFVPLCQSLDVAQRFRDSRDRLVLVARMVCGYQSIRESFTSRVTLDRERTCIVVNYVDGPFRYLENQWRFHPTPNGCEVAFDISYEFRSRTLALLVGGLFDKAFRRFTSAFEIRASEIYTKPTQTRIVAASLVSE